MSQDQHYYVHASAIDSKYVEFECPFCWTKYKKNGEPWKNAKRVFHVHGSGGDLSNRITHKVPHCDRDRFPKDLCGFAIAIDDSTIRK